MRKVLSGAFLNFFLLFIVVSCKKNDHSLESKPTDSLTRVIYAIKPDGSLGWYRHLGYENGTAEWENNGVFKQVGENWQVIQFAFRADSNIIYGVNSNGELGLYRHLGWQIGSNMWENNGQFKRVGEDWQTIRYAFSGGGNIIYAIKPSGELGWYKHLGQEDGTPRWENNGQFKTIATGWQDYTMAFSAGNGIIYAIKSNGELGWFKHLGYQNGSSTWENNGVFKRVGEDWNLLQHVFYGGNNIIYAIKPNGDLGWYKHLGQENGTINWANNGQFKKIASGWSGFKNAF